MDIKYILKSNRVNLVDFAAILNISRPTLNQYIKMYESGKEIPNSKIHFIFDQLFSRKLNVDEFRELIEKYERLINRDVNSGLLDLDVDKTDLYYKIVDTIKNDFLSDGLDVDFYDFLYFLISHYKENSMIEHYIKYINILNDITPYSSVDFKRESYLLHYFKLFSDDISNKLEYDKSLEKMFISRIEELKSLKVESENYMKKIILNEINSGKSIEEIKELLNKM